VIDMKSSLYKGMVTHRRLNPLGHLLRYKIFYLLIDLDELEEVARKIRFLSVESYNFVSFFAKDFGEGDTRDLRCHIKKKIKNAGILAPISSIRLLCIPRIFGYAFNPLSTYYCYNENEELVAIVYEVSNTFKERHSYILPVEASRKEGQILKQECEKALYVSPFMPMNCTYKFSILPPAKTIALSIKQFHDDRPMLNASFVGTRRPLDSRNLALALFAFPFNSFKVIAGIHWEALKLWLKGAKLVDKPVTTSGVTDVALTNRYQEK
jgi:uncharacterized protein